MSFTTNGAHVSAATAKFPADFLGKVFGATIATDVNQLSELQQERLYYELQLPKILKGAHLRGYHG
jgi:hypothetical protein